MDPNCISPDVLSMGKDDQVMKMDHTGKLK